MPGDDVDPPKPPPRKRAPAKKAVARKKTGKRLHVVSPDETPPDSEVLGDVSEAVEVEIVDRAWEAYQLRVQGVDWHTIIAKLGHPSIGAAQVEVSTFLSAAAEEMTREHKQLALQTQIDRYEKILSQWWDKATKQLEVNAAMIVLRTLADLNRVQRLEDLDLAVLGARPLVIAGSPEQYVARLQAVVAGQAAAEIEASHPLDAPPTS